jgi:hypothetical protein
MNWRRPAWLVPIVVFLATFGVFGVRHPGSVKAMVTNAQGLLTTGAALVVIALFLWAATFRPKIMRVAPYVIAVGILGGAFYAEVPFERTSTQNRRLVAGDVIDAADTVPTTTSTTVLSTPPPAEPGQTSSETVKAPTTTAAPRAMAVRHSTGMLRGINHSASGDVSIIESADGQFVVRFENFTVQGSPEPVLYVLQGDDKQSPGGTNLGAFTATSGTLLDVALPAGVEPGPGWTVLIWCEKFDTPIANATQH